MDIAPRQVGEARAGWGHVGPGTAPVRSTQNVLGPHRPTDFSGDHVQGVKVGRRRRPGRRHRTMMCGRCRDPQGSRRSILCVRGGNKPAAEQDEAETSYGSSHRPPYTHLPFPFEGLMLATWSQCLRGQTEPQALLMCIPVMSATESGHAGRGRRAGTSKNIRQGGRHGNRKWADEHPGLSGAGLRQVGAGAGLGVGGGREAPWRAQGGRMGRRGRVAGRWRFGGPLSGSA